MRTFFTLLLAGAFSAVYAQTSQAPSVQPYGKVDIADLELKSCDFEKDANAEVLFEKGNLSYSVDLSSLELQTHRRIKIFNEKGNEFANIHLQYLSGRHLENITGIIAEQGGSIMVRYSINYNKIQYSKDDYPSLHEFYKKMYEMLNEQIILKKS